MTSKEKVNAMSIIAIIIGASGLGIGAFSVIRFQLVVGPTGPEGPEGPPGDDGTDGIDGIDGTLDNLVSVWASLNQTNFGSLFNITLRDNRFNDTSYLSMTDNVNFALIQEGWYRFTISFLWGGLTIGSDAYSLWVGKNGSPYYWMELIENPTALIYLVKSVAYIYSDGDDSFFLYCDSVIDTFYDIDVDQPSYTQFVIEYIAYP